MATDLFPHPGFIAFEVGINSRVADQWGVVKVGPGIMPVNTPGARGWPKGLDPRFWRYDTQLQISATGTIDCGVPLAGQTNPDGWPDFDAPADDCYCGGAPRYALVGALTLHDFPTPDEWFFVGSRLGGESSWVTWQFSRSDAAEGMTQPWPGPSSEWRSLFVAVNRPPPSTTGASGSGAWAVRLQVQVLDRLDGESSTLSAADSSFADLSRIDLVARPSERQLGTTRPGRGRLMMQTETTS